MFAIEDSRKLELKVAQIKEVSEHLALVDPES
jgi:hypothetical protein